MSDARVALVNIADKVPYIYNTIEGWVVNIMRLKYVNRIIIIFPNIYQKNKVQYFSNKFSMMIFKIDHGKFVNWVQLCIFD